MNKGREKTPPESSAAIAKTRRTVIIITAALLAAILVFGGAVGAFVIVKNARACVKYGGTIADSGVTAYLLATYKSAYMKSEGAVDTPEYWAEETEGTTRGELLRRSAESYVRSVIAGAYLYDRYSSLAPYEKSAIDTATREVLDYKASGSERRFNELAAPYGFDYDDFCTATELIYKAEAAKSVIYGKDGSALTNLSDASVLMQCNSFFNLYSRVKILYIDTKEAVVKDAEGKIELDADGNYKMQYLTGAETVSRLRDIDEIRNLILGAKTGVGDEMSPEYFDLMQDKYNISAAYNSSGYYLSPYSEFTKGFVNDTVEYLTGDYRAAMQKMLVAAIDSSFVMNEGEYYEIEGDFGVCFIYKCEKQDGAYLSSSLGAFFHDFYSDAATYLYSESVSVIAKDVEVKEKYNEIDVVEIPYNYMFVAKIEQ